MIEYSRLHWSSQQEDILRILREDEKLRSWNEISKIINKKFPNKNRSGKQCRERYMNYVRFGDENQKITTWDLKEQLQLFQNFIIYGPKWVHIAQKMKGRSENCLKNRFYGIMRRLIRKIERFEKEKKMKQKKFIKLENFIKILYLPQQFVELLREKYQGIEIMLQEGKKKIIELATNNQQQTQNQKIQDLIHQIQKLTHFFRFDGKKLKNGKNLPRYNHFSHEQPPIQQQQKDLNHTDHLSLKQPSLSPSNQKIQTNYYPDSKQIQNYIITFPRYTIYNENLALLNPVTLINLTYLPTFQSELHTFIGRSF